MGAFVLLITIGVLVGTARCDGDNTSTTSIIDGHEKFTFDVIEQLRKDGRRENIFFSPVSLATVLGMVYMGASGKTAEQIRQALYYNTDDEKSICSGYHGLLEQINNVENITLELANRLYHNRMIKLGPDYKKSLSECYEMPAQALNFKNSKKAAKRINNWVKKATHRKIKDLISPDSLNADTALVLVNGVYFKGNWKAKFPRSHTKDMPFYHKPETTNEGPTKNVPMMHQKGWYLYRYIRDIDAYALELPYKDDNIKMLVVLPRNDWDLYNTTKQLKAYTLEQIASKLVPMSIDVFFPRMKIKSSMKLEKHLQQLGITEMFTKSANFSRINNKKPLEVSQVVQKAFIEVNEEGTEAAAATGMTIQVRMSPPEFRANHPFVFFIRDTRSKVVLFAGTVEDP